MLGFKNHYDSFRWEAVSHGKWRLNHDGMVVFKSLMRIAACKASKYPGLKKVACWRFYKIRV